MPKWLRQRHAFWLWAAYKAKAGARGYQTLINQALRDALLGEQIDATIRKAIREELRV